MDDFRWKLKTGDCIFFMHIPKTAGTTLYEALRSKFPPESVLILPEAKGNISSYFLSTSPEKLENIKFCRQHFKYSYYKYFPKKLVFITMLRDPVARVYSFYKHILRVEDHKDHETVVKGNVKLLEYMTNIEPCETSNLQVRYLVGILHSKMTESDMLEIAKMRLHEFAFFGISEKFSDSIKLLAYTFDWDEINYISQNQAPIPTRQSDLSQIELEAIMERNKLDLELYQYALDLFEQRVSVMTHYKERTESH